MIICPNCQHPEINGAIYCGKCGAQLFDATYTQKIQTSITLNEIERNTDRIKPTPAIPLQSWISLHIIESGQILPLAERTEFTLGRSAEGQPIFRMLIFLLQCLCQWGFATACSHQTG